MWGPENTTGSAAKSEVARTGFVVGFSMSNNPPSHCWDVCSLIFMFVLERDWPQALLHEEMENLKRRRAELKRESKQAAKDQKLLAAKRQRLLKVDTPGIVSVR